MTLPNTLRKLADDIEAQAPVVPDPIGVMDLPEQSNGGVNDRRAIWLDSQDRPTPVNAARWYNARKGTWEMDVRSAYHRRYAIDDDPVVIYPESAGPALWQRYLLGLSS